MELKTKKGKGKFSRFFNDLFNIREMIPKIAMGFVILFLMSMLVTALIAVPATITIVIVIAIVSLIVGHIVVKKFKIDID
jgi:hypothetical protein